MRNRNDLIKLVTDSKFVQKHAEHYEISDILDDLVLDGVDFIEELSPGYLHVSLDFDIGMCISAVYSEKDHTFYTHDEYRNIENRLATEETV